MRLLKLLFVVTLAGCGASSTTPETGALPPDPEAHGLGARLVSAQEYDEFAEALDPEDLEEDDGLQKAARPAQSVVPEAELPPVADQGELMSCAAFAMSYDLVSHVSGQRQRDLRNPANQVSPAVAYRRALDAIPNTARQNLATGGTDCAHYLNTAVFFGGTSNATVPYPNVAQLNQAGQCDYIDALNVSSLTPEQRFGIGSWFTLDPRQPDVLKDYLAQGQLIAIGASVQENLSSYRGNGVYESEGRVLGGHAMTVTGYDDERRAFRVRNSWGPSWGDRGSLWMGYDTFNRTVTEAYVAQPAQEDALQPSGGQFAVEFAGGQPETPPTGAITRAYQEPATGGGVVLVMFYYFNQGVQLDNVVLQSPSGKRLAHQLGATTRNGYYYFTRTDGNQWLPGAYPVEMGIRLRSGNLYTCRATLTVSADPGPTADFPAQVTGVDGKPAVAQ